MTAVEFEAIMAREIAETDRAMTVFVYGLAAVVLVLVAGVGYAVWRVLA